MIRRDGDISFLLRMSKVISEEVPITKNQKMHQFLLLLPN